MQQYVNHTKPVVHGSSMHDQGSDIVLSMPSNHDLEDLFVFAFLGGAASPAESTEVDLWLSYDTKHERIVFEDSTCDYNRNVYTLLVLSSIVLLMFFIGVQVRKETQRSRSLLAHCHVIEVHVFIKHQCRKGFPDMIVCMRHTCVVIAIHKDILVVVREQIDGCKVVHENQHISRVDSHVLTDSVHENC